MTIALEASSVPRPFRAIYARIGKNVWAVMDQALISGANFITMMLALRGMGQEGFGAFALVYSALLFANMLQAALITQPHNVLGATRRGENYVRYTTAIAVGQLWAAFGCGLIGIAAWLVSASAGWSATPLLLALAPCLVAWQLQEFARRVLYTEGRYDAAFANDAISYGLQMVAIAGLWWRESLTGPLALDAVAATSLLAAVVGAWQLRGSIGTHILPGAMRLNWNFGKWIAGAELLNWLGSIHVYLFLSAAFLGTAATGELKGAQIIFGPTRVFAFCLGTILPIQFAKTFTAGGDVALKKHLRGACALVAPLTGSYCLFVILFAAQLLHLLYGDSYTGSASTLMLFSACTFVSYLQMVFTAALTAKHRTREVFFANLCGGIVALSLSFFFIHHFAVRGAVLAMIAGGAAAFSFVVISYFRSARDAQPAASV